ncbi:conserved hypothetical protein [Culex quinquefasciatus]|uniref:Uncharacterized protein n=1 Tax=Culex quinquefasciatus TaxID=7176 RepID=B0XA95_CULQU|nr:conserved hypothetical protein [Culex quinquefasciatus]|eukprot:XP_001866567.1 conserved hypothetical protein [Culex quinquefasciatus]
MTHQLSCSSAACTTVALLSPPTPPICFILHSGQYHLPFGGIMIPTHSKWNHSMRQLSPSQAIISETSSYGHRQ